MNKNITTRLALVIVFAILLTAVSHPALAQGLPCITSKWSQANQSHTEYNIELTFHREDLKLVTYSSGWLAPAPDGSFSGLANQLFSDRLAGKQPFSFNAADSLSLNLSSAGFLKIHYSPWNFDTDWMLSCQGSMLTTYLPNSGIVTLTFRDAFSPQISLDASKELPGPPAGKAPNALLIEVTGQNFTPNGTVQITVKVTESAKARVAGATATADQNGNLYWSTTITPTVMEPKLPGCDAPLVAIAKDVTSGINSNIAETEVVCP